MGDVASFTSLRFLPESGEENPPLFYRLQNACQAVRDVREMLTFGLMSHQIVSGGSGMRAFL